MLSFQEHVLSKSNDHSYQKNGIKIVEKVQQYAETFRNFKDLIRLLVPFLNRRF